MSTSRTVARGTSRLLAGLLSAKALDFLFYLVLARRLGVGEFGRYTFAMSFTMLFTMLADLGVQTVFTRELARAPGHAGALLRQVLGVKLGLGLVTMAVTTGITLLSGSPDDVLALVVVLTAAMLINSTALLFENVLKSAGRAGSAGMAVLAQSATGFAVGTALLLFGFDALGGALAYLAAALAHLIAALAWSRSVWRDAKPKEASEPAPPWRDWVGLIREAAPMALSWAFITVYFRIDSVLLNVFKDARAVGLYGGVYRLFEAFVLISAAYRSVLFPVMARAADGPRDALGVLCRKSLRLHLLFTVGVAVFMSFQARQVIEVVLGKEYAAAAPALAILIWALPGAFMADTLLHLLVAQRRQKTSALAMAVTAAFNVIVNLIVIPRFSFVGAAATTVASEILSFTLMYVAFRGSVPRIGLFGVARAPLMAGGIAGIALTLLAPLNPGGPIGLVLMGTFAISAYVLALVALGALGREDAELVQEMLPANLRLARPDERRASSEA